MAPKRTYTGVNDPNKIEEQIILPSTIETIDVSLYDWVNEKVNIHASTNKGFEKAPVLWISAERAYQIKNDKQVRDDNGALIFPLITVQRNSITKDPKDKGIFYGNIPSANDEKGGSIVIAREINQDKTRNFQNAYVYRKRGQINFPEPKSNKVVYNSISIPMPVHVNLEYVITLRAEYQQQINEMVTPFITKTDNINYFTFGKDGHTYEGLIQPGFKENNNVNNMETEERKYETKITIKVVGYLIGQDSNQDNPKVIIRENAVEVKMPRERVMLGDKEIIEYLPDDISFYRE